MLREKISWVLRSWVLLKGAALMANQLLHPEVGRGEVAHTAEPSEERSSGGSLTLGGKLEK